MYKKVTLAQVKKAIKENGIFNGFAVGNRVSPSHFFNGWCLAMDCEFRTVEGLERFNNKYSNTLDKGMGDRLAWYEYKLSNQGLLK